MGKTRSKACLIGHLIDDFESHRRSLVTAVHVRQKRSAMDRGILRHSGAVVRLRTFMPFGRCSLLLLLLVGMSKPGLGQAQTVGKWSTLSYTMPINPIHVALLFNGKILVVAGSGNCPASQPGCPSGSPYGPTNNSGALLLDPSNGNINQFSESSDMFFTVMVVRSYGPPFVCSATLVND